MRPRRRASRSSLMTGSGSGGDAQGDTLSNIENLTGSNFDDTLEGNSLNNVLVGGLGTDTVSYANATSGANGVGVTVNLALTTAQNTVTAGTDTLSGFENLTGSQFNDTLIGSGGVNVLMGLGGNDTAQWRRRRRPHVGRDWQRHLRGRQCRRRRRRDRWRRHRHGAVVDQLQPCRSRCMPSATSRT